MHVTSGTQLGPYEIVARLGAGGMGEVWSARDTRLERLVAVKILPAEYAQDPQFKLRFEREARTISQLSHPNICTLFDVGDGFLVMELLEGETVADRIARGPMPLADVLRYGVQIADALGAAHRMGIVHRDLKPANVMITKSGAKLLDFGLAKSAASVAGVDDATRQKALTQEGTILGTFQYMAPEQLEGQEADVRTDIFAFGTLLYEMATGRRAFEGKTRTSLIAQIVSADPKPLRELAPLTPPAFEHVVARCLSKDPDERWQSAQDIGGELRWAAASSAATAGERTHGSTLLPWVIAGLTLLAAIAAIAVLLNRTPAPRVTWSDIAPPRLVALRGISDRGGSAISPDGNKIIFVGQDAKDSEGVGRIYLRNLGGGDTRVLTGTEGASFPFWSPDSQAIAFFAEGKLKRIEVGGTKAAVIATDIDGRGGTWSTDGTIVFAPSSTSGLSKVRAAGGKVESFLRTSGDQSSLRFPSMLPDGKHFLYFAQGDRDSGVHLGSLDGAVHRKLTEAEAAGVVSGGWMLFLRDGSLFAQELDVKTLELRGDAREIAGGVSGSQKTWGSSDLSVSAAGDVLFPAEFVGTTTLVWRDRKGAILQSLPGDRMYYEPAFASDERRLIATTDDDSLWEVDVERGRAKRLPLGDTAVLTPSWSPDSKRIFFWTSSGGKGGVASAPAGGGKPEMLVTPPRALYPGMFTPDGAVLVLDGPVTQGKDFDVWQLNVTDRKISPLLSTPANEVRVKFSPDGRFLCYTSDETGRPEIFVQTWPLSDGKWQITFAGGDQPFWRGDGKELFYLAADGKLMSVQTDLDAKTFADPVLLFQTPLTPVSITGNRSQYLVPRDGQRFLLLESPNSAPTHLTLVQNFSRLLEK